VVEVPLWKSSYRLTLSGEAATGRLQGWAVLENNSGHTWENVELTLISGNPVTFRQALYTSYYVSRPEVPLEVLGRILPRTDSGALENKGAARDSAMSRELRRRMKQIRPKPSAAGKGMMATGEAEAAMDVRSAPGRPPSPAALFNVAESSEAAAQVLFRLPGPVSVKKGYSVNIPIIDRDIPIRRLSVYQPETHARHPLASLELINDSAAGLPPGVLTIYEAQDNGGQFFVGDARLGALPAGEERRVSFALDQKTRIDKTVKQHSVDVAGTIRGGIYHRKIEIRQTTTYRLKSPVGENRKFIIEHPRRRGWKLTAPSPEKAKLTAGKYRIEVVLEKAETRKVDVVMTRPVEETIHLSTLSPQRIGAFVRMDRLSSDIKNVFVEMGRLLGNVDQIKGSIVEQEKRQLDIARDQKRIRDNLARIPRNSDLHPRYMNKMNTQEDSLDALAASLDRLRAQLAKAKDALAVFIASLDI
jgi:hypothetical protein